MTTVHLLDPDSIHRGRGRKIKPGQKIHASVTFSSAGYRPKAVLPSREGPIQLSFDTLFKHPEDWGDWLEMDLFDLTTAQTVISDLESPSVDLSTSAHLLTVMTKSGTSFTWSVMSQFSGIDNRNSAGGCRALRGVTDAAKRVFHVLQRDDIKNNVTLQAKILNALIAFATDIPG